MSDFSIGQRAIAIVVTFLVSAAPTMSATGAPLPVHAYEFQGSFEDSGTGDVTIQAEGGVVGTEFFEFDPMYPGDYNEGLTLANPNLANPGVYSIEMRLKYVRLRNETPPGPYGPDQAWIKTIDYTDGLESYGLFVEDVIRWGGPGEEGKIEFIASTATPPFYSYPGVSPDGVIVADTWFHTVVTRDSGGLFTCYVDGIEVFQFNDSRNDAVIDAPSGRLRFFQPDQQAILEYNVYEVTKGAIDYLRLYDEPLSGEQVAELFSPLLVGDYNADGVVDAADYTVWRNHVGYEANLPNDPVRGTIGERQYENWRANYGASSVGSSIGLAIPEPTGIVAQAILLALTCPCRRRMRKANQ